MSHHPKLTARGQQMFALIEKYLACHLTQKAFCEQEGLSYSSFQFWLRKYRVQQHQVESHTPASRGFIPLRVQSPSMTGQLATTCLLEYPNGLIVRLSGPVEIDVLARLIESAGR